jgi:hypothetical protein
MKLAMIVLDYIIICTCNKLQKLRFSLQVLFRIAARGLESISYRGVLLSTLLHATVYIFTQFAECTGTDCK